MDVLSWVVAPSLSGAVAAGVVMVRTRRAGRTRPPLKPAAHSVREPIVIQLPPESRLLLTRERGLSYKLSVDDAIEIRGLNFTQVAGVVRSFVDAHVPVPLGPNRRPPLRSDQRQVG